MKISVMFLLFTACVLLVGADWRDELNISTMDGTAMVSSRPLATGEDGTTIRFMTSVDATAGEVAPKFVTVQISHEGTGFPSNDVVLVYGASKSDLGKGMEADFGGVQLIHSSVDLATLIAAAKQDAVEIDVADHKLKLGDDGMRAIRAIARMYSVP